VAGEGFEPSKAEPGDLQVTPGPLEMSNLSGIIPLWHCFKDREVTTILNAFRSHAISLD
jgi:hypothetical protein